MLGPKKVHSYEFHLVISITLLSPPGSVPVAQKTTVFCCGTSKEKREIGRRRSSSLQSRGEEATIVAQEASSSLRPQSPSSSVLKM